MKEKVPSIDWQIKYYDGEWVKEKLWFVMELFGGFIDTDMCITDITFMVPEKYCLS